MTQSLELLLDDQLDEAVRAQWRTLQAAGLPSQARHTGTSNAPHITLAVAQRLPEDVERRIRNHPMNLPVNITLGGLLLFGRPNGRQVLVRSVVATQELLELHAEAARLYEGLEGTDRHLAPGHWTPHVTLAHGLTPDQLATAVTVLTPVTELEGQAVAVRRWDSDRKIAWVLAADTPAADTD
ncbi:2'-5' RNA ligase family protein [Kineosporia succinea]|uniref:2'-5' RNA ligase n=1 Tax=Kineosporia succinea TaxID=84632 RepID=A0ABT9P2N2_9ACTN|nr:2'-5' RNA ligase family protein [Kineosporia succinea]MDP9826946.1 2'-5' RNA ligase [Kineosporia succinea]